MSRRGRHPLKTLILLGLLAGVSALVWHYKDSWSYERRVETPNAATLTRLTEMVETRFSSDDAFFALQSAVMWREHEQRFRIDIDADSSAGKGHVKALCQRIAEALRADGGHPATVFAYDGGAVVAKCIL